MKRFFYLLVIALSFALTSCYDAYTVETMYAPDYYTIYPYTRVIVSPTIRVHSRNRHSVRYRHYPEPSRITAPRVPQHRNNVPMQRGGRR